MGYDYLIDRKKEEAERKSLADHIRAKGGTTEPLTWGKGFEDAVDAIGGVVVEPLKVQSNGTYQAKPGQAFNPVEVAVPIKPEQTKEVNATANGNYVVQPDKGYVMTGVTVRVRVEGGGGAGVAVSNVELHLGGGFATCDCTYTALESGRLKIAHLGRGNHTIQAVCGTAICLYAPVGTVQFTGPWESAVGYSETSSVRIVPEAPADGLTAGI